MRYINELLSHFHSYPVTEKVWGKEICLTNNQAYCCKYLVLADGMQCSLHRHHEKMETFFVLSGKVGVKWGTDLNQLRVEAKDAGDALPVYPGTWHRFWAIEGPAVILEVSTHHDDSDVERADPSGPTDPF